MKLEIPANVIQIRRLTDEDPREEAVSVVTAILSITDVGNTEHVQLLTATAASRIDGEEDRPGDDAANKHQDRDQLEEAQQQIRVHRVVLQDVGVGKLVHGDDPVP